MRFQHSADVRELTATLATEIGAIWPVRPQSAVLTPAEPRFAWSPSVIPKDAVLPAVPDPS